MITIALAHDEVSVTSENYTGGISKNGEYAIEWVDNICTAPASFKALVTPYAIRNNNCQECVAVPVCDQVVAPAITLPDATEYTAYSHTAVLTGTAPFTLSNIVKPGWMTISVTDDTITFSGTPVIDDEGVDIPVTFDVSNDCGSVSVDTVITVVVAPCIAVGIVGSPSLPDGFVDVPYAYSFDLTGSAPFALAAITKPAWMEIVISGSTVEFSGTPDADEPDLTVEFTITNCDSGIIDFSDLIDITVHPGVSITGSISNTGHAVIIDLSETVPCDVTFPLDGIYDMGGTQTPFSTTVTVLAGYLSGSNVSSSPIYIITCIEPNDGTTFVFSFDCLGITYNFVLEVENPC